MARQNLGKCFFRDCAWHGPFKMGAATGNGLTQFEKCEFIGATAQELGYGGKTEYFGSIGGTDGKALFRKCKFERTFIYGGQVTECLSSTMSDVVIYGQENSEILFDNILASNLVNLGNNHFSVVNVRSSTFSDRLTFEETTIGSAVFENVIANLDLTMVKAVSVRLDHVTFKGADKAETYLQYGLSCESSKIQSLTIENCNFDGFGAELHLSGEETPEELAV